MHIYSIKSIALIPEASVSNEAASASDCYGLLIPMVLNTMQGSVF